MKKVIETLISNETIWRFSSFHKYIVIVMVDRH